MKRLLASVALFASMAVLAGCSSEASVEGKVIYKGNPVGEATVVFQTDEGTTVGTGMTDASGVFKLRTPQNKDKIPAGTYKVLVMKTKAVDGPSGGEPGDLTKMAGKMMNMKGSGAAKNELPEKYGGLKSTPLTVKIPSKEAIELKID